MQQAGAELRQALWKAIQKQMYVLYLPYSIPLSSRPGISHCGFN